MESMAVILQGSVVRGEHMSTKKLSKDFEDLGGNI